MNHRLLILGTLGEFVQLVQKAKQKGYYTIVCDGYPNGEARAYADASYVLPVTDTDAIAELCKKEKIDGIITSFSDLLMECMVKIAAKADLPCYLKPEQLPWYRDKSVCRQTLSELGLPTPGYVKIPVSLSGEPDKIKQLVQNLSYPLISKPMDKYGSRGIYIIYDERELAEQVTRTAEFTDLEEVLVEEYNDGFEFNMMTWVNDGKVNVISIADREKTQPEADMLPISTRNAYPSRLFSYVYEPARDVLQSYIAHTGQMDGPLSMQFFWKPGKGIQVCEIAARFFGYEHELTDMVYGFNIEELLLAGVYQKEKISEMFAGHDVFHPMHHGAVVYFHGKLRKIADQTKAYELAGNEAVAKPWIFYKTGEAVVEYGPNPYLALYYIGAESREKLDEITGYFFDEMSMTDPDGREITYRNQIPDYFITEE